MARFTPILGQLSGKVAGNIFSRNKGGSYLKRWVKPTNPRTQAQGAARGNFSVSSSAWNSSVPAVKAAWNTYALSNFTPKVPRAGVTYSGFSAFQSLGNAVRNAVRSTRVNTITNPSGATCTVTVPTPPQTAPAGIFSAQVVISTGVFASIWLGAVTLTTAGVFTAGIGFSQLTTATPPTFTDPVSGRKFGLIFYGGRGDDPSSKNLQILNSWLNPAIAGTWAISNAFTISAAGADINISARKLWYSIGQKVVVTCFAISEVGEYKFIGQTLVTVA